MALTTLLQIVTRACDELGVQRPGTIGVYASSLPQDRQMLALLQAAGRDLMSEHDWSALVATASVDTASASASYSLPTNFDRLINDTGWDRTNDFPMHGGIVPQRHQYWLSSGVEAPTTRKEYRLTVQLSSSTFTIHPTPTATETLSFLYIRNTWVYSGATYVAEFAADTDTTVFNPQLMVKELKWRFRAAKGLDATDLISECEMFKSRLIAGDIGAGSLDMSGGYQDDDFLNVPDSSWTLD